MFKLMFKNFMPARHSVAFSFLVLVCWMGGAQAQDSATVLARGPGGIQVTAADVEAYVQQLPFENRQSTLARVEAVTLIVDEVFARRVLAQKLVSSGALEKDFLLQAVLQGQRERTLAESYAFSAGELASKDDAKVEALAKDIYRINIKRFQEPVTTRARHILFAVSEGDADGFAKAVQQAEGAQKRLQAGEAFEAVARELSADTGSASNGGDLGYFAVGKMVPEFDAALQKLVSPGDVSSPVKTKFGVHLIKLEDRRLAGQRTYEEMREQLMNEARMSVLGGTRRAAYQDALAGMQKDNDAAAATAKRFAETPAQ